MKTFVFYDTLFTVMHITFKEIGSLLSKISPIVYKINCSN